MGNKFSCIWLTAALFWLCAAVLPCAATTPTVDPTVPAENSVRTSLQMRQQFQAIFNDETNLYGLTVPFGTANPGIVPLTGAVDATHFLNATGGWTVPAGGSSGSVTLGTSTANTNPARSSQLNTGLYSSGSGLIDFASLGVKAAEIGTSGISLAAPVAVGTTQFMSAGTINLGSSTPIYVNGTPLATGGGITALTGDVTASGSGSVAAIVAKINGVTLGTTTATAGNILVGQTSSWLTKPLSGDCTLAATGAITCLNTNGVAFGSLATLSAAPAGTLSGTTLAAGVTASSLTSVGTLSALTVTATITGSITGNSATVTTNANLTGVITSSGNATSIASQTGTGTTFVTQASPFLTGTVGVGTASAISTSNAADFYGSIAIGTNYANTAAPSNGLIAKGNVGIGTSTAGSQFTEGSSGQLTMDASGNLVTTGTATMANVNVTSATTPANGLALSTTNTPVIVAGSTGILTFSNPSSVRTVAFAGSANEGIYLAGTGGTASIFYSNGSGSFLTGSAVGDTGVMAQSAKNLLIGVAGASGPAIYVNTASLVAIGTTTTAGAFNVNGTIKTQGYIVSALPAGTVGMRSYVTDQLTACVVAGASLTGGGGVTCPVFYNGSAWVGD